MLSSFKSCDFSFFQQQKRKEEEERLQFASLSDLLASVFNIVQEENDTITTHENVKGNKGSSKHLRKSLEMKKIKEKVETALERGELPCSKEEAELISLVLEQVNPSNVLSTFPGISQLNLDTTSDHDHSHSATTERQEDSNSFEFIQKCFEIWASEREKIEELRVVVEEGMNGWEQVEDAVRGVMIAQRQVDCSEVSVMNAVQRRNEKVMHFLDWGEGDSSSKCFVCLFDK